VAGGAGVEEGPAFFEEVVEFALLVAGAALLAGEAAGRAGSPEEDVGEPFKGDLLAGAELLLLFLDLLPE
jgi:hypothetical protein